MKQRILGEIKQAMRSRDGVRLVVLRGLMAEIKNSEIDKKQDLNKDEIVKIVQKEIKKRREAIEMYKKVKREELVAKEEAELKILEKFAPKMMSEEEIRKVLVGYKDKMEGKSMGEIMQMVMGEFKGKAEGGMVSKLVQELMTDN